MTVRPSKNGGCVGVWSSLRHEKIQMEEGPEIIVVPGWAYLMIVVMMVAVIGYIVVMQTRPDLIIGGTGLPSDIRQPTRPAIESGDSGAKSDSDRPPMPEQMDLDVFERYDQDGIVREAVNPTRSVMLVPEGQE